MENWQLVAIWIIYALIFTDINFYFFQFCKYMYEKLYINAQNIPYSAYS